MTSSNDMPQASHEAVLRILSNEDDSDIWVTVDFEPPLSGKDIQELGYLPAAYAFFQNKVLPMLEEAFSDSLGDSDEYTTTVN